MESNERCAVSSHEHLLSELEIISFQHKISRGFWNLIFVFIVCRKTTT